jgi:hypothetical protein
LIGNDDTLWIRFFIEFTPNCQTGIGGGCADQIHDDAVADECFCPSIHADEREQTVGTGKKAGVFMRLGARVVWVEKSDVGALPEGPTVPDAFP